MMDWIVLIIFVYLCIKEWNYWVHNVGKDEGGIYIEFYRRKDRLPNIFINYYINKVYLKDLFRRPKNIF